jgi:hypothetical protein
MNHTIPTPWFFRLLLVAGVCLVGDLLSASAAAAHAQNLPTVGQAKPGAGYKGPGFVLVNIKRSPPDRPVHDTGKGKQPDGSTSTTRYDVDTQAGDSSYAGTYKDVFTIVDKVTGQSRDATTEKQSSVSWTPPPAVVPPGYVYQPQPKLSGYVKGSGALIHQPGLEPDPTAAWFSVTESWGQPDSRLNELSLSYGPNGIKTWINKPLAFPDMKRIQEALDPWGHWQIDMDVGANLTFGNLDVDYVYEYRPEVTIASAPPLPQEPPEPPQKPGAPPRAKPAPSPANVSSPEIAPKPPAPPAAVSKPPATTAPKPSTAGRGFEVYNLGDGVNILQSADKPRGTSSVEGGKLIYQEAGKTVFSVGRAEITEIDANSLLGYNTGTFHVILKSGKTYNFAPASLDITDGQRMLEHLKQALR